MKSLKIVALAGGVGGAKLVYGLAKVINPKNLSVIVNTGDDFEHYGLYICPDLDTVCYNLAGLSNPKTGWGRRGDTFHALQQAILLGGLDWFKLGDLDLGTHLERTRRIRAGETLSTITADFCRSWGIATTILPMTDQIVSTYLMTDQNEWLSFQDYFVRRQCKPVIRKIETRGSETAKPAKGIQNIIQDADFVIICPSNPWLSIDPILAIKPIKEWLHKKTVIAVSPIIHGATVRGPAAKISKELGINPSASSVAEHYKGLIRAFVIDTQDELEKEAISLYDIIPLVTNILMTDDSAKARLASEIVDFYLTNFA